MSWYLIALAAPFLYALSNIFDSYLTNRLFKHVRTLPIYVSFFTLIFVPLAFLIEKPSLPAPNLIIPLLSIGLIEILYQFPYFKALQSDDTSIVSSLFEIGRAIVPVLAFIFVHEHLTTQQYIGFGIVSVASILLTYHPRQRIHFNASLWYMLTASLLLSIETVLYKKVFNASDWGTGFIIPTFFTAFAGLILLVIPNIRSEFVAQSKRFTISKFFAFAGTVLLTFGGAVASTYAISLRPVTYERSVEATQPIFVLLIALVFSKAHPRIFKEHLNRNNLTRKLILFGIMIAGITLVVR